MCRQPRLSDDAYPAPITFEKQDSAPLPAFNDIHASSPYQMIGVMKRRDTEGTSWTEYLMHNPAKGFMWLVETDEGWFRAQVLGERAL